MKCALSTILLMLALPSIKAQDQKFISLQSAIVQTNSKENTQPGKEWICQEIYINFDLANHKLQFFSKGLHDGDSLVLQKQLDVSNFRSPGITSNNAQMLIGLDSLGNICIVKIDFDFYKNEAGEGELRLEYQHSVQMYKIRKKGDGTVPIFKQ